MKKCFQILTMLLTLALCMTSFLPAMAEESKILTMSQATDLANDLLADKYGIVTVQLVGHAGWHYGEDPESMPPHGWMQLNISNKDFFSGSTVQFQRVSIESEELVAKGFLSTSDGGKTFVVDTSKVVPNDPDATVFEGWLVEKAWFEEMLHAMVVPSWDDLEWLDATEANSRIEGYGLLYSTGEIPSENAWPQMQLEVAESGLALPAGVLTRDHFRIMEDGTVEVHADRFDAYVEWARGLLRDGYGK